MAKQTYYFVRHGQSQANAKKIFNGRKQNPSLTEIGRAQIRAAAERAGLLPIDHVYSSDLKRARESAQIIAEHCHLETSASTLLDEVYFGDIDGLAENDPFAIQTYDHVVHSWENGDYNVAFPNGDSMNDVLEKFTTFIQSEEIQTKDAILIVGHTILIRVLIWKLCHNHPAHFDDGWIQNGRFAIFEHEDSPPTWKLIALNTLEII